MDYGQDRVVDGLQVAGDRVLAQLVSEVDLGSSNLSQTFCFVQIRRSFIALLY